MGPLVIAATASLGFSALAATPVRIVARTGDAAPGFPAGTTISSIATSTNAGVPRTTPGGLVYFAANVAGTSTDNAIFIGRPGALDVVARHSDPAFAGHLSFTFECHLFANDSRDVVFAARRSETRTVHGWHDGVLRVLAGDDLPSPLGGAWQDFYWPQALDAGGRVVIPAKRFGEPQANWVFAADGQFLWTDAQFLGRSLGASSPYLWTYLNEAHSLATAGRWDTYANFARNLSGFDTHKAIARVTASGPELLLSDLEPPPGLPGLSIAHISVGASHTSGMLLAFLQLAGPGVTNANNSATCLFDGQYWSLVHRRGDPIGGLPEGVSGYPGEIAGPDAQGRFITRGTLSGAGVTPTNSSAILTGDSSGLRVALRAGDQAPGLPAGFIVQSFLPPSVNASGLGVFALIAKSGTNTRRAVYAIDPGDAIPRKVLGDSDPVSISTGEQLTAILPQSYLPGPASSGDDGVPTWINDDGEVVLVALLSSGAGSTYGVILVPAAACRADANGDSRVDFLDLNIVLGQYTQAGPGLPGDLNDDGVVNFLDLNLVLSEFGRHC